MSEDRGGVGFYPVRVLLLGGLTADRLDSIERLTMTLIDPKGAETDSVVALGTIDAATMSFDLPVNVSLVGRYRVVAKVLWNTGFSESCIDGGSFMVSDGKST
jgi:hypothetical protein